MKIAEVMPIVKTIAETASAEEQVALWKLVSDNVWQAIATQAEQERRAKAERAPQPKVRRGRRGGSPRANAKPVVPKVPISPSKTPPTTAAKDNKAKATTSQQSVPQQQVQPKPYGATGLQPRAPIAPILPIATSAAVQSLPQALAKQLKPKITARAGGVV